MDNKSTRERVTAIIPYKVFPPKMGGQKGIALFYKYLGKHLDVSLITTSDTQAPADYPAVIYPVLGTSGLRYINPFLIFKIRNIMKQNDSRTLIIEHPYLGWLGLFIKFLSGCKLIVHSHNIESLRFKSTGRWWWGILWNYERLVHRFADMSFFVTEEDRQFAIRKFALKHKRTVCITYGIEESSPPSQEQKAAARAKLLMIHRVSPEENIYLFNGTLDYKPNQDALTAILEKINPLLLESGTRYKIIICGKNLPAVFNSLKDYADANIIYAGFVDDINSYFLGSDVFLNPLVDGGGIKTKLVEAIGNDLTAISTKNGAIGVPTEVSNGKLFIVEDGNWITFVKMLISANTKTITPKVFYNHFYWANIAEKAAIALREQA